MILIALQRILLIQNGLISTNEAAFSGLRYLKLLHIASNVLSHAPDLQHISHSLELINLNTGRFESIPHYFRGCGTIRHVFFNNANMTDLFWGLTYISDHVIELNFSLNRITSLSALYDVFFAKLERLQLQENMINAINLTRLHLPVLQILDIRRNYLTQLDDPSDLVLGSMSTPKTPMSFYVSKNPWHCNGSFDWLTKEHCNIQNDQNDFTFWSKSAAIFIMEVDILTCESPPDQKGTRIIDVCGGYHVH